jgi:hypothetical protein
MMTFMGRTVLWVLVLIAAVSADRRTNTLHELTFLTRDGCVNTPDMTIDLDDALSRLKLPHDYQIIDIGTLPKTDVRAGYPTPTVLWKGKDIFKMPIPKPPFGAPS